MGQGTQAPQGRPCVTRRTSVALLLHWEADIGKAYPSRTLELVARVSTFTAAVHAAVGVDNELPRWLASSRLCMRLPGGLPHMSVLRSSVRVDPALGEPFLGNWKAHLRELVRQHQSVASSADPGHAMEAIEASGALSPRVNGSERAGRQPLRSTRRKRALSGNRQRRRWLWSTLPASLTFCQ